MTERSAKPGAKSGAKPRRCGPFIPDPDVPPDANGRGACAACHLIGEPGDAHHPPLPDVPHDDVQRRAAGERSEG